MKIIDGVLKEVNESEIINGYFKVPENVKVIDDNVFINTNIEEIDLSNVEEIEGYAFAYSKLKQVIKV